MSRRTGSPALALAALLVAASPAAARAALALHAGVDRDEIAADETVTLEIRVEAESAPSFSLPKQDFDFTVVSEASSQSWSAGLGGGAGVQIRHVTTFQFGLAPRRSGQLTIPPIHVVAGPASADTPPIPVKVLPAGSQPAQPQGGGRGGLPGAGPFGGLRAPGGSGGGSRAWHGWERELMLLVELDRKEAFLGEQVTARLSIVSPVGVVELTGFQAPQYDGFWTEELERAQQLGFQVRQVNGLPVRVYPYLTLALFPTRAGELELGAFELSMVVRVGADDPFDPFPDVRRITRRSQPVKLTVKPLPAGAPAAFDSVNVGTISLSAALSEKAAVAVGQPVTLRLTAQGEGNVKAWSLPAMPRLPGLRTFAPTSSDKVAPQRGRIAGTRTIETVLVAEQPGTLTVPPVGWPVFDPRAGKYQVLTTQELRLEVLPAGPTAAAAATPGQNALGGGLRPIRGGGALTRRADPPWSGLPFWILLGAPVVLFAALTGLDRLREHRAADGGARRLRLAGRVARTRLAAAARLAGSGEAGPFFAELERALLGYCGDKLQRTAAGMTRDGLQRALSGAGAHPPAIRALTQALDACDAGGFGGTGSRAEVLALAGRAMELLEEAHWKGPGGAP